MGKISVISGDICELDVEAIVNPANSYGSMGGGVAGQIKALGGQIIEDEAKSHGLTPVGNSYSTTAGLLKAKYIIHAPTMKEPMEKIGVENVNAAMNAALDEALRLKISSIAFPGMGCGVGCLSNSDAAKTMVEVLSERIFDFDVYLIGFEKELTYVFEKWLKKLIH